MYCLLIDWLTKTPSIEKLLEKIHLTNMICGSKYNYLLFSQIKKLKIWKV